MITKYGLPIIAIALIVFAVKYLSEVQTKVPELPPPVSNADFVSAEPAAVEPAPAEPPPADAPKRAGDAA